MSENKLIKEYLKNKKDYEKLVRILRSILEETLVNNHIDFQAIQSRIKDEDSLRKHLGNGKYKGKKISSVSEIPDLAACRVIFYSRADFEKFKSILQKEFKIEEIKDKMLDEGYRGCHLIGSLGKKRKHLVEYRELANLKFEIQITLIFAHGWNEWEHDIFYKDKLNVKNEFPGQFELLKKMAIKIAEQLKDAQDSWEDVKVQYQQAAQGKNIFSSETLQELSESDDNNEIYNRLNNLNSFIHEVGELPATLHADEVAKHLSKIIEKVRKNKSIEEKTIFGTWPGKTEKDIVGVILKLASSLAYKGINFIVDLLLDIYPKQSKEMQGKIEEWFKEFSKYKYHTLKNQGYIVQGYFMDLIKSWDSKGRKKFFGIIRSIGEAIFNPDFEGTTHADYKTISFQRGSLGDDKNIRKIRDGFIDLLIKMHKETDSVEDKLALLQTLNKAMQTSSHGGKIRDVIRDNVAKIVSFYNDILPESSMMEIAEMEDSVIWANKRFSKDGLEKIKSFWSAIEVIGEYSIYRILVGYDRAFRLKDNIGYEECEKKREEKVNEFITEINKSNTGEWERRITSIAGEAETTTDVGEYSYFGKFLQKVGEKKSELALMLLLKNKLKFFRENIIAGLLLNDKPDIIKKTEKFISDKIKNGQLLYEIIRAYWFADIYNKKVLETIFIKALKKRSRFEKVRILWQLLLFFKFEKKYKKLILKIIKTLNMLGYYQWTSLYYHREKDDIFSVLADKEWDVFIKTLVDTKSINYHEEQIIEALIKKYPKKFSEIFRLRVVKGNKQKGMGSYEAIPYQMHYLTEESRQILMENSKEIIDDVLKWFDYSYGWQAGIFLKSVYPNSDSYLDERINEIIDTADIKKWNKYVLSFIKWHRSSNIEAYVKRTVEKMPKNEAMWNSCMIYLLNPDGTSGNIDDSIIGDAYRKKLEMVAGWKSKNKNLNEFKQKCIIYLEKQIKIEDEEHKQRLAAIKRKYPNEDE